MEGQRFVPAREKKALRVTGSMETQGFSYPPHPQLEGSVFLCVDWYLFLTFDLGWVESFAGGVFRTGRNDEDSSKYDIKTLKFSRSPFRRSRSTHI